MAEPRTVLVTGATGLQGGTVARTLLGRGHQIRALTRHPDAPAARALRERGATVVQGDFDDHRALLAAAAGTDAVFLMSTPFEGGAEVEARQGVTVAEAAAAAGAAHLVYSSVASADQNTAIPHFDSKRRVERRLQTLGVAWTVLAPASFMDGFAAPWTLAGLRAGRLAYPLPPQRPLQQVAVADLASLAALAIEQPDRFAGRRLDLAGDELTGPQIAAILAEVTGRRITYHAPPPDSLGGSDDMVRMLRWLDQVGYHADIAGCAPTTPRSAGTASPTGRGRSPGPPSTRKPRRGEPASPARQRRRPRPPTRRTTKETSHDGATCPLVRPSTLAGAAGLAGRAGRDHRPGRPAQLQPHHRHARREPARLRPAR